MNNDLTAVTGLLIAIVTVVFVGLIWLIKKQFDQSNTSIKDNNEASRELASSINNLSILLKDQHESLKVRDKRDEEFQKKMMTAWDKSFATQDLLIKGQEMILATQDRNLEALQTQTVETQTVLQQIVKRELVEHHHKQDGKKK